jgi:hypothetical protein
MLIAAASPIIDNASKSRTYQQQEPFKIPTLPKALENAKLRWTTYGTRASVTSRVKELQGSPAFSRGRSSIPTSRRDSCLTSLAVRSSSPVDLSNIPTGQAPGSRRSSWSQWTADRVLKLGRSAVGDVRDHHHLGRLGRLRTMSIRPL